MIADATTADRSTFDRLFDVCVIGSGPAGITVARRLAAAGADVALMEAGGLEISAESQDVYVGENLGQDYFELDTARLRYFGGTSNHWAGWSRPLDPVDFVAKPFNPLSGWPIPQIALDPYRPESDRILDIPSASEAPDLPFRQDAYNFRRFQFRWSPPTRFAEKYGPEIEASERIQLILNANLVDLRLSDDLESVIAAKFRGYAPEDPGFIMRARTYCLATGGIENPRLLLNFTRQMPQGIGNGNDLVGRFFCEHPHFVLADVLMRVFIRERQFYAPTEAFMVEHEALNFGMRLEPNWLPSEELVSLVRRPVAEEDFAILLSERVREPFTDTALALNPAVVIPPGQTGVLRMAYEQALNPDSRVRLSDSRDAFGMRRVAMDWHLSDLDVHTMRTAVTAFGAHMAAQNIGRAQVRDWLLAEPADIPGVLEDEVGGKHHMGTTRMADDPRHGVVDADCRVHGIDNLFIGGSSVFASGGHANPTYTIIQLALRLGDHLAARLQG